MYKATSVTNNPLVYPHQFFSFCWNHSLQKPGWGVDILTKGG